jgi:hypothetical protein
VAHHTIGERMPIRLGIAPADLAIEALGIAPCAFPIGMSANTSMNSSDG